MNNFDAMQYLMSAGNSKEVARELIRISHESGVPLITNIHPYNNITELENTIRKKNMSSY